MRHACQRVGRRGSSIVRHNDLNWEYGEYKGTNAMKGLEGGMKQAKRATDVLLPEGLSQDAPVNFFVLDTRRVSSAKPFAFGPLSWLH